MFREDEESSVDPRERGDLRFSRTADAHEYNHHIFNEKENRRLMTQNLNEIDNYKTEIEESNRIE